MSWVLIIFQLLVLFLLVSFVSTIELETIFLTWDCFITLAMRGMEHAYPQCFGKCNFDYFNLSFHKAISLLMSEARSITLKFQIFANIVNSSDTNDFA
jgi:hypothetical protein